MNKVERFRQITNIIISILFVVCCIFFLNKENEKAINNCISAGNTKTYCEYHA